MLKELEPASSVGPGPRTSAMLDIALGPCLALVGLGGHGATSPIGNWCVDAFSSVGTGREFPAGPPELEALGRELDREPGNAQNRITWLGVRLALRCTVALRRQNQCRSDRSRYAVLDSELRTELITVLQELPAELEKLARR